MEETIVTYDNESLDAEISIILQENSLFNNEVPAAPPAQQPIYISDSEDSEDPEEPTSSLTPADHDDTESEESVPDYAEDTVQFRRKFRTTAVTILNPKYVDVRHAYKAMKNLIPVWEAALKYDRQVLGKASFSHYCDIDSQVGDFHAYREMVGADVRKYLLKNKSCLRENQIAELEKFEKLYFEELRFGDTLLVDEKHRKSNARGVLFYDLLRAYPDYFP